MTIRLIILLFSMFFLTSCTAMLVGGDVSSRTATDCDGGQQTEACKKN